jgi:hypothetical protein
LTLFADFFIVSVTAMEPQFRMKKTVAKLALHEQKPDFEYWQTQSYEARLAALEQIRREYHLWKYHAEPRLQRVYKIVKR